MYKNLLVGRIKRFPYGTWQGADVKTECRKLIRYFIEEVLKCPLDEAPKKVTLACFQEYGLYGMIQHVFKQSTYAALECAYPGRFKRWEFGNWSRANWTRALGAEATTWLIKEKLKWTYDRALTELTAKEFEKYGLYHMLLDIYQGNIMRAVLDAKAREERKSFYEHQRLTEDQPA